MMCLPHCEWGLCSNGHIKDHVIVPQAGSHFSKRIGEPLEPVPSSSNMVGQGPGNWEDHFKILSWANLDDRSADELAALHHGDCWTPNSHLMTSRTGAAPKTRTRIQ